ncbi:MAG: glycosyltransferase [Spirochaetales bacterium]|nr:glycosyltransferase [Spirochaetales bacterium]
MKKIIIKKGVDIVHITGPGLLGRSAIIVAGSKKIPVVHTFHTLIYKDTYLYYALRSRKLVPLLRALVWKYIGYYVARSDIMTAPSQYLCDLLNASDLPGDLLVFLTVLNQKMQRKNLPVQNNFLL